MNLNLRLVLLLIVICFGCDKPKKDTITVEKGVDVIKDGVSVFSFRFIDKPPDGIVLKIDIHQRSISAPCDLYKLNSDISKVAPLWYVMIRMGSTQPGVYEVNPLWDESKENSDKALVLLSYVSSSDSAERYEAIGGSIELETAPGSIEDWNNGVGLIAELDVIFPKNAIRTVECEGACMDIDGGASNCRGSCVCEDINGHRTTCEHNDIKTKTCCFSSDEETITLKMTIDAEPCPEMCDWIVDYSELGGYCFELI